MAVILLLALVAPQTAQAHPEHAQQASSATAAAVARFEQAIAGERAAYRTLPVAGGPAPNLAIRVALEQAMRRAIDEAEAPLSGADRAAASSAIWRAIAEVDSANTAYLKSILPTDGWFRSRRDGAEVARHAWLIVQHSPDQAFQRVVVARMRPLVATGDARSADYALLHDRTEMFAGRPQLYGSQMSCDKGRWQPAPTIDPAGLDRRRAAIGLPPIAEYLKNFQGGC